MARISLAAGLDRARIRNTAAEVVPVVRSPAAAIIAAIGVVAGVTTRMVVANTEKIIVVVVVKEQLAVSLVWRIGIIVITKERLVVSLVAYRRLIQKGVQA